MVASENTRNSSSGNANNNGTTQKRRLSDFFMTNKVAIDYKDTEVLRRFLSPEGKILPGRRSGLTSVNQRKLTKAIKRARQLSLLPYVNTEY